MPLDIPRDHQGGDDNGDGDWIDLQGYQAMNVINMVDDDDEEEEEDEGANDEGDEDESDFDFTSDDEEVAREENAENYTEEADRYAHYQPIRQMADDRMNGGGGGAGEPAGAEADAETNQARNIFYQHNYFVQWITTDQPLFDREQFEARQTTAAATAETALPNSTSISTNDAETSDSRLSENSDDAVHLPSDSSSNSVILQPGSSASTNEIEKKRREDDQSMDEEKIDVIKGLMSGFKLPEESVPGWAKEIPEEQWKSFINQKMDGTTL